MDDQKTQTTDGEDTSSEANGNTDLNELVKEFNDDPPKPQPDLAKLTKAIEPLARYVEDDRRTKAAEREQETVKSSIQFLKEDDALKEMDDDLVEGYLHTLYSKDEKFRSAYDKRGDNPDAWNAALEDARPKLAEKVKDLPGNKVRSDVEAATAAVRGASAEAPDDSVKSAKELHRMSDVEFRRYKQELDAG